MGLDLQGRPWKHGCDDPNKCGEQWHRKPCKKKCPTHRHTSDWREWKVILKQAGVREVRVHDTRHTAGTMLIEQGVQRKPQLRPSRPRNDQGPSSARTRGRP
ncbi:hypothetical protein Airi02_060170 [Actinoallomurus iriomotensis]|uniref:Tyr recombinase domain-containing protein n=1 Tax=Actinoallomurus iriomotensis TaxID=478107 RepID=A0A9W6VWQ4_9ACTN|nr:hypothetical protein Airi02_060170 [Actinoallomurus iriomotensis]